MSLSQSHSECVNDPDSPPTGPPIPGVVFAATDCSGEMTATINGQTEEFPCVISLNMSTGVKSNWPNSYKSCLDQAIPPPLPGDCETDPNCRAHCEAIGGCDGFPPVDCESLSNRLPAQILMRQYPQCRPEYDGY